MYGSSMKRAKALHEYQLRAGDQIPTRPVTLCEIMSRPTFALGVADARAGRSYPADYDAWEETNDRWDYERGRQWAQIAPRSLPLKIRGKLNPQALQYGADLL